VATGQESAPIKNIAREQNTKLYFGIIMFTRISHSCCGDLAANQVIGLLRQ
jgi:hypothetical protein